MATQVLKSLPAYTVRQQDIRKCPRCGAQMVWQKSYSSGKMYPTEVKTDTMQNLVSCRNWFHQCPVPIPQPAQATAPQPQQEMFGGFNVAGILALFAKAQQHLKFPKIKLSTLTGQVVLLRLAGQRSKTPGHLQVTDGEKFGFNKYFGRIAPNGSWHPGKDAMPEVVSLLNKLSEDPAGVAAAYGKLTGNCCFCNLPLTDTRSTNMGYGPVCADHYGLPWG